MIQADGLGLIQARFRVCFGFPQVWCKGWLRVGFRVGFLIQANLRQSRGLGGGGGGLSMMLGIAGSPKAFRERPGGFMRCRGVDGGVLFRSQIVDSLFQEPDCSFPHVRELDG